MMKGWTPESERLRMRAYRATERGKAAARAYRASAKGKAAERKYRQSASYAAKLARYRASPKGRINALWQRDRRIHACGQFRGRAATPELAREIRARIKDLKQTYRTSQRQGAADATLTR